VRVIANGKTYDVGEPITVGEFVRERGLDPQLVVVELNGEALERSRYDRVRLTEGDRLELVRAVAGG
jgi:sulfur carrier protein